MINQGSHGITRAEIESTEYLTKIGYQFKIDAKLIKLISSKWVDTLDNEKKEMQSLEVEFKCGNQTIVIQPGKVLI